MAAYILQTYRAVENDHEGELFTTGCLRELDGTAPASSSHMRRINHSDQNKLLKTGLLIVVFTLSSILSLSADNAPTDHPTVQSLREVAPKTDETARLLAHALFDQGSFQKISPDKTEELLGLLNATRTQTDSQDLPRRLKLAGGFNGTGGGGGIACFGTKLDADQALDKAGRIQRNSLSLIRDFDVFDSFRVIHRDSRRWADAVQGDFHLRKPLPGEKAETFLRRVLYQNVLAFFPLLVERLMAVMIRYPFATWHPVTGIGLPFYPDLDHALFQDLRRKENTCVYTQLAIRTVKNSRITAEQVQYFYDQDLLNRLHRLAHNEEQYQLWLAMLILHEHSYLLARELGAQNAENVHYIMEMAFFEDANIGDLKAVFFEPGSPNPNRVDQAIGQLFEQPYLTLLADEKSISPWPSKAELYKAWMKTMRREQELRKDQEVHGCKEEKCMSAGGLLWRNLFDHPEEVRTLTPAEAYFALTPSLSINNQIPSPEALVARSVDPRGALDYSCRQIDFEDLIHQTHFTMHSPATGEKLELNAGVGRLLFMKIKEFCTPTFSLH